MTTPPNSRDRVLAGVWKIEPLNFVFKVRAYKEMPPAITLSHFRSWMAQAGLRESLQDRIVTVKSNYGWQR